MERGINVYFIPGLGADSSIFRHLQLPPFCKAAYLDWIQPQKGESLPAYASRPAASIDAEKPFVIVGMSFGGMLATEIAAASKPLCTILLSSVPSPHHLPRLYRVAGRVRAYKLIPVNLFRYGSLIKRWFSNEKKEDKVLLKKMIRSSDPAFIKWALEAILTWKGCSCKGELFHIHGDKGEILPYRCTQPTHTIAKGTHMMVLTRAREVSAIMSDILQKRWSY